VTQQERNVSISQKRCVSRDTNDDGITQIIIRIYVSRAETFMWEAARDLERTYVAHCGGKND
jgi:hypothetical protein